MSIRYSRSTRVMFSIFHLNRDPLLRDWYMIRLKIPVNRIPMIIGIKFDSLWAVIEENISSSPIAFGKGGRPRFAQANISHRRGRVSIKVFKPRFTVNVRELVRS